MKSFEFKGTTFYHNQEILFDCKETDGSTTRHLNGKVYISENRSSQMYIFNNHITGAAPDGTVDRGSYTYSRWISTAATKESEQMFDNRIINIIPISFDNYEII
jgi:hypothetical protein